MEITALTGSDFDGIQQPLFRDTWSVWTAL